MTATLDIQPWMHDPDTVAVMDCLRKNGGEARFVGGCVRDALLGRPIGDIDIATDLAPEGVMQLLEKAGIRCVPTGIHHGTVTAVINHKPFEITTLRRDVETDGRRAIVAFTDDWQEDAARRDFTMNALYLSPDGTILDYFNGVEDALSGHIRFVGNAKVRLEEDVLRLLRYFRFFAHYGAGEPDAEAIAACQAMAPLLPKLAAERIRVELMKLLFAPAPVPTIRLMQQCGVFEYLSKAGPIRLHEDDVGHLAHIIRLEKEIGIRPDAIRRLAALCYDVMGEAESMEHAQALRLSNEEKYRFTTILAKHFNGLEIGDQLFFEQYHRVGPDRMIDICLVALAAEAPGHWYAMMRYARVVGRPEFALQGRDALALGVPKGESMGRLLQTVKAWWVANGFQPSREACAAKLAELAHGTD